MKGIMLFAFALMSIAPAVLAQAEQCASALTLTGRNELLTISQTDRRAYFYRQSCTATATDASLNFEKAQIALGLSYASRQLYCDAERQQFENYQFDYLRSSTVVEKALESWLACVRLWRSGILLRPQVAPTSLVLSLERGSRGVGIIREVSATAGTVCKAVINGASKTLVGPINFTLPNAESWTITCDRKAVPSSTVVGATIYPETTVILDTTDGAFPITLEESPKGPETWAAQVNSRITGVEENLTDLKSFSKTRAPIDLKQDTCTDIQWGDCTQGGWAYCPKGQYLVGLYNAGGGNSCVRWLRCCSPGN